MKLEAHKKYWIIVDPSALKVIDPIGKEPDQRDENALITFRWVNARIVADNWVIRFYFWLKGARGVK